MAVPRHLTTTIGSLVLIGACVAVGAGAFAYTAGWLTPDRLSPQDMLAALAPPGGAHLGYRRNHAKGICFSGVFRASGDGAALTKAAVFAKGEYPVFGRFNLGTTNPGVDDGTVRVRGMGLDIEAADGATWRMAMINAPVFPVSTPQGFYDLQQAAKSADPKAMPAFIAAHPSFGPFGAWAGGPDWTGSYAEEPYNSLNSFRFTDGAGTTRTVRWSFTPDAPVTTISPEAAKALGPDHLEQEIEERVANAPQSWTMRVTVADPADPTNDPTQVWPEGRQTVVAGTLVVNAIEDEAEGPCLNINFDPTILPDGVSVSDDPFPAARSAAYAKSYDLRTAEIADYRKATGTVKP